MKFLLQFVILKILKILTLFMNINIDILKNLINIIY